MTKRKMHGSAYSRRMETLGEILADARVRIHSLKKYSDCARQRKLLREANLRFDALTFALDVINDLLPTKVAYEAWGGKMLELSLNHSYDKDGKLLVFATLCDYTACAKPPHEDRVHVMRIDSDEPLGTHEPRTADNALWLDMIAGMEVLGVFGVVETVREPKALLTCGDHDKGIPAVDPARVYDAAAAAGVENFSQEDLAEFMETVKRLAQRGIITIPKAQKAVAHG